uniref:DDE Tnp4 domain-containing protein n=1 Tax=Romanomermis culicivorax TaxID=13658 RepID=A0A915IF05_ROMCU
MDDTLLLLLHHRRKKRQLERRWYVRPINEGRLLTGQFHTLVAQLELKDPEWYFKYFRMTPMKFHELAEMLKCELLKPGTHKMPIGPSERLALTLRARRIVENAFGIMCSQWQIFNRRIEGDPTTVDKIVKAVVCLHNYLKKNENSNGIYAPSSLIDREDANGDTHEGDWRTSM